MAAISESKGAKILHKHNRYRQIIEKSREGKNANN